MHEKILERIRKLLGSQSIEDGKLVELTDEQIEDAFKGTKVVDVLTGGYVDQEKHARLLKEQSDKATAAEKALNEYKEALDGDDGLKKQVSDLTAENATLKEKLGDAEAKVTKADREKLVREKAAHLSPKMQRVLLADAEDKTSDSMSFEDALAKVMAEDDEYAPPAEGDEETGSEEAPARRVFVGTAPKGKGSDEGEDKSFDAFMAGVDPQYLDDAEKGSEK